MGNIPFIKSSKKKRRAKRVGEVRLRRSAVQRRQQLGQWPVLRVEVLHRRVGRRDSVIGSVSKTKTRHNIVFVFFSNLG